MSDLREFLTQVVEYMDHRADVDEPEPGQKVMNEEGHLMVQAQRLLDGLAEEK